jgi:WD40 repeat protein
MAGRLDAAAPPIVALAVTPGGDALLAASQAGVGIHRLPSLEAVARLEVALETPLALAFSPDGQWLALVGGVPAQHGQIEVWRWADRQCVARVRTGDDTLQTVGWSSDSRQLLVAGDDKSVQLWRWTPSGGQGTIERAAVWHPHSAGVTCGVWLPWGPQEEEALLTGGMDHTLRLIALPAGRTVRTLDQHTAAVRHLAVEPAQAAAADAARAQARSALPAAGPLVASASADRTVRLWQPRIGRLVRFARLPSAPTAVAWTPDGRRVLAACEDGHLRSVDRESVQVHDLGRAIDGWAYAMVVSLDGRLAIVGGADGRLNGLPLPAMMRSGPQ